MKWMRVVDGQILLLGAILTIVGAVLVFDAGYARSLRDGYGAIPRESIMQLVFGGIGLVISLVLASVSQHRWRRWAIPIFVVCLVGVVLPMVPGIGVERNGAHRWIRILGQEIQPAEFAKIATILFIAAVFAGRKTVVQRARKIKNWGQRLDWVVVPWLKRMLPVGAVMLMILLIEFEPDLGTAAVVLFTAATMAFMGGIRPTALVAGALVLAVGVSLLVARQPYRLERVDKHLHRWSGKNMDDIGYQTVQSELAMASGGVFGVGIGQGRAKHLLPAATTDFIPATIGEEFGLVGVLLVLGLLGALSLRLLVLASKAKTPFASLVLGGTGAWIGIQSIVNVSMANGALPAIGIPLPFVSYGGSSLVALWVALGLCQAVLAPVAPPKAVVSMEEESASGGDRWRDGRTRLSRA